MCRFKADGLTFDVKLLRIVYQISETFFGDIWCTITNIMLCVSLAGPWGGYLGNPSHDAK